MASINVTDNLKAKHNPQSLQKIFEFEAKLFGNK